MTRAKTVLLADEHELIRRAVRRIVESEPDFSVAGETSDGLEVLRLVQRSRPDVVVVDRRIPGLGGLELTSRIAERFPGTKVVVLSGQPREQAVVEALRSGASAYLLRGAGASEIVRAIRAVLSGRHYLSWPFTDKDLEACLRRAARSETGGYETLTPREREVLHLVARGLTSAEIGRRLFISARTVESHRASLMRKLGMRSQKDLIRYAFQRGLLPVEENPRRVR